VNIFEANIKIILCFTKIFQRKNFLIQRKKRATLCLSRSFGFIDLLSLFNYQFLCTYYVVSDDSDVVNSACHIANIDCVTGCACIDVVLT
jgi:hypothetical protein